MVHAPQRRARAQATLGAAIAVSLALWTRSLAFLVIAGVAVVSCLLAWVAPRAHVPIQKAVDALSRAVVRVASWTTLGLVYFGVFTPLRFIARLFGRDPLALRRRGNATSYFKTLPTAPERRFERQF